MYIKILFKPKDGKRENIRIPVDQCQKMLNSYIHQSLGANNPYHDTFSDYNISGLQGTRLDTKTGELYLDENGVAFITVSAHKNDLFLSKLTDGMYNSKSDMGGLVFDRIEFHDHKVNRRFDTIVTTSPILLIVDNCKVCVENPDYINLLQAHCMKKLKHVGIDDETFSLSIRRPDRARKRMKWVGNTWNICSDVSLRVTGKPSTRLALYELGLGGSTGSGFGSIKIFE